MTNETKASDTAGSVVVDAMLRSKLYRDYRKAFTKATGLPLELHAPEEMKVHRPTTAKAAPFCGLIAKANASCAACYALQRELEEKAQLEAKTFVANARLSSQSRILRYSWGLPRSTPLAPFPPIGTRSGGWSKPL